MNIHIARKGGQPSYGNPRENHDFSENLDFTLTGIENVVVLESAQPCFQFFVCFCRRQIKVYETENTS